MKNYQQTPKQRRIQKKKLELSKRRVVGSRKYQQQHFSRQEREDVLRTQANTNDNAWRAWW
jgi:hypothetical protein